VPKLRLKSLSNSYNQVIKMISTDEIKEKGVVGAGGAGFPTYVKFSSEAEIFIVNAAECEPLLHKDMEILLHRTDGFLSGLSIASSLTSAQKVIIGIKKKHADIIRHLEPRLPDGVEIFPINDFYPAGDEITLIYEATGRVVAPGQLPLTNNVIVSNVETLYNLNKDGPVTTKFLNIVGEVQNPVTVEVPIGTPIGDVLKIARPGLERFQLVVGGPMMGHLAKNLEEPVTKTTGGLIVLPEEHILVQKMMTGAVEKNVTKIAKAACDQCSFCTELCPRALLGHPIQPHKAMRSLQFSVNGSVHGESAHTLFCCECNLCTVVSCPEGLYPSQACIFGKRATVKGGFEFKGDISAPVHPLIDYRRVPSRRIKERLDLLKFRDEGDLAEFTVRPRRLEILLKQHIGAPAKSLVTVGQRVQQGEKIATVGDDLGAEIHSSLSGAVVEINEKAIIIEVLGK